MSAVSLAPGQLFAGDFEVVKPLGSGGMGAVYVALQKSTGKQRALKVMHAELAANRELCRRFEQEARIGSLIESAHVVEVVGAGVDEPTGSPWLAMELLDGRDLESEMSERGPMKLEEVQRVLRQVCHALAAAHAAGIVHRDLKPENVFLARSKSTEGGVSVKLLDFGIAKIVAEAAPRHTAALGSPVWMAPEQTERGAVTPGADVWAIGLLAFYLLTGHLFWLAASTPDGTVQQIMREVLFEPIPRASARARQYGRAELLPAWFDDWFERCVTRAPDARFPSAATAFATFDRLRDAPSRPPEASGEASLRVDRRRSSTATAPTQLAPSIVGSAARASLDRPIADTPAPERSGNVVRPAIVLTAILVGAVAVATVVHFGRANSNAVDPPRGELSNLPPELASTPGAAWYARIKARCNPVEVGVLVQSDPPPPGKDGAGFAAACYAIAGKIDRARATLDAVPAPDRPWAADCMFEVVHPIADAGDDVSAGPAMRLVLEYWPDNYMALYHAGMSEFATKDFASARRHLRRFLVIYKKPDGFTASATRVLAELSGNPSAPPDCRTPLTTDPEGRKIYPAGCGS